MRERGGGDAGTSRSRYQRNPFAAPRRRPSAVAWFSPCASPRRPSAPCSGTPSARRTTSRIAVARPLEDWTDELLASRTQAANEFGRQRVFRSGIHASYVDLPVD